MLKKKLLLFICSIFAMSMAFAQYPAHKPVGNDSTLINAAAIQSRIINWVYPDTATANTQRISHYPGAQIMVVDTVFLRNSTATKWITIATGVDKSGYYTATQLTDTSYTLNKPDGTKTIFLFSSDSTGTGGGTVVNNIDTTSLSNRINNKWDLNGNLGTTTSNFIGTKDNKDLFFKTNSILAGSIVESAGQHNTSLGRNSLPYNSIVFNDNSAFGYYNMGSTTGNGNTSSGAYGMFHNTTGWSNTVFGVAALFSNLTSGGHSTLGSNTLYALTGGTGDIAIGDSSLRNLINGMYIIGLGYKTKWDATSLNDRTLYISDSTQHLYMKLDTATGTAPSVIGKDANGFWHVYQTPTGSGGNTYTAGNGLTMVGNDVELGGTLTVPTSITTGSGAGQSGLQLIGGYDFFAVPVLNISSPYSNYAIRADIGGGNVPAIYATADNNDGNIGVVGEAHYGIGVKGMSYTGKAGIFSATGPTAVSLRVDDGGGFGSPMPGVSNLFELAKTNVNNPAPGYGISQNFILNRGYNHYPDGNSTIDTTSKIVSYWTDTTLNSQTAALDIYTIGNKVLSRKLSIAGNGQITFDKYGAGAFTGTLAKSLGVDANGNMIEYAYTASNGLTKAGNDTRLGGDLSSVTSIFTHGYQFSIYNTGGTGGTANGLNVSTTQNGNAITASSNNTSAYLGGNTIAGQFISITDNANTITPILQLTNNPTNATAAPGIGASIEYYNKADVDVNFNHFYFTNSISSVLTDVGATTRKSKLVIKGIYNSTTNDVLSISGDGLLTLLQGVPEYTDNTAATTAGLTIGTLYRTGDTLKVVH